MFDLNFGVPGLWRTNVFVYAFVYAFVYNANRLQVSSTRMCSMISMRWAVSVGYLVMFGRCACFGVPCHTLRNVGVRFG